VPYETVCELIGEELADALVMARVGFQQTAHKPKMLSKDAIEKMEMRKPHDIAAFDREDLLDVIEDLIEEKGGLDELLNEVEDNRSVLQKLRDSIQPTVPFTPPISPQKEQDDSEL